MTPDRWQEVKKVLGAALEREPAERAAYLDRVCAEPALRREVESLIAAHEQVDSTSIEPPASQKGALKPGTKLGPYEILAPLGVGGMGEVYQARDSKLRRDVAIKIIRGHFVQDSDLLSRFKREAHMLAALNHPNIAVIYGLEEDAGRNFLAMELISGQTLDELLRASPLQTEEALRISCQIAEALEAAHEKGVIHRDLKPSNVKVTPEGRVKVLDFGLAKALSGDNGTNLSEAETLSMMCTEQGRILGTPAYMSPEQARGKPVDRRADIWSFGCVLYELLTGRRAFRGDTIPDTLAAVLERAPDWQALPATTPPKIGNLLRRCLNKDPQRRLRDIGDARIEIEEALSEPATPLVGESPRMSPRVWRRFVPWTLAFVAGSVLAGAIVWKAISSRPQPLQPVARMVITPPGENAYDGTPLLALSPDGNHLVSVVFRDATRQLYLREINQLDFTPLAGTEGARNPFFSPDSQWIGFLAEGKLKKISVSGGTPQVLCDSSYLNGATWGPNNTIVFTHASTGGWGMFQVSADGGQPSVLTTPDPKKQETGHLWPSFLPGGKAILFTIRHFGDPQTGDSDDIAVQSLVTGERRVLLKGGTSPRYVPTGHLVYLRAGRLMAAPFDLSRLNVTGTAVPVVERVLRSYIGAGQFDFSNLGWLVYAAGYAPETELHGLAWVDRKGMAQPLPAPPRHYDQLRLSPDGRRVAVALDDDIWIYDLSRDTLTRITSGSFHGSPVWTPDSTRVTFDSNQGGHRNLFWKLADGSGEEERLSASDLLNLPTSWSPDGKWLVYTEWEMTGGPDIWALPFQGDRKPRPLVQSPFDDVEGKVSPDGHWLAYLSNESGRSEVYLQAFPGPGGRTQISTEGGTSPEWSHNGKELFYLNGSKMMAAEVSLQPNFTAGKPRQLFDLVGYGGYDRYDVAPDGQRFLMVKTNEPPATIVQLNVVLNWFEELKLRVPPGK